MTPTADQVRRAYATVPGLYGATVMPKASGASHAISRIVGAGLEALGIMTEGDFLAHCATTLGPLVLVPYTPGVPRAEWDLVSQLSTLAHEIEHVRQWWPDQLVMPLGYLLSSRERALLEVDAMKPAILLRHHLQPFTESAGVVSIRYAERLHAYRCDGADQECARTLLLPFVSSVLAGAVTSRAYPQVVEILDAMGEAGDAP